MFFETKIYYKNKPLLLSSDIKESIRHCPEAAQYPVTESGAEIPFEEVLRHLAQTGTPGILLHHPSPTAFLEEMATKLHFLEAGGGIVLNPENAILMIFRRGKWDLPKGKRDPGESIADCAIREVKEETGVAALQLLQHTGDTWHIYEEQEQLFLKKTIWYLMSGSGDLLPQAAEAITQAEWTPKELLQSRLEQTYPTIRDILISSGLFPDLQTSSNP